jgi:hypothetical protein
VYITAATAVILPSIIQLVGSNGYASLDTGDNVLESGAAASGASIFYPVASGGYYYLVDPVSGSYLTSYADEGNRILLTGADYYAPARMFLFTAQSSGLYTISSYTSGELLAVQTDGDVAIYANVADDGTIPATALFQVVPVVNLTTGAQVKLQSANSSYGYLQIDSIDYVVVGGATLSTAATFRVLSGTKGYNYLLETVREQYVATYTPSDGLVLLTSVSNSSPQQRLWKLIIQSNGAYVIQSDVNGELLAFESIEGLKPTVANSGTIPDNALFYAVSV